MEDKDIGASKKKKKTLPVLDPSTFGLVIPKVEISWSTKRDFIILHSRLHCILCSRKQAKKVTHTQIVME